MRTDVADLRGEMTAFMTELRAMLPPAAATADAVTTELRAMRTELASIAALQAAFSEEHGTGQQGSEHDEGYWSWHESEDPNGDWDSRWRWDGNDWREEDRSGRWHGNDWREEGRSNDGTAESQPFQ